MGDPPNDALPSLNENNRKELGRKAYSGSFSEVPGAAHTWRKSFAIDGESLTVVAAQTRH